MTPIRSQVYIALTSFWGKWFVLAFLTGCLAGVAAIVLDFLIQLVQHFTLGQIAGFQPGEAYSDHSIFGVVSADFSVWLILPIITAGGLVTGVLVYWLAPEAEGAGTDAAIDAFHNQRGNIPLQVLLVKLIASAITIGTGGSAGREGPIAQIGGGIGSCLGKYLKLSNHDKRMLLAIGMGAGVGAIFRAPLAGAIFSAEILYREADLESSVIVPGAVASTVAYSLFQLSLPAELRFTPLFGNALHHDVAQFVELIPFTVLAFAMVAMAIVYISTLHKTRRLFQQLPILPHFKPFLGALATGLLAMESADVPKEAIYYLVGVDKARFKQPVVPGDQVRLEVEVLKHRRDIWVFTAEAKVGDNIAASAELMCTARNL